MRLLWVGAALEIFGLLLAILAVANFGRVTMLALFGFGFPAIIAGMVCYAIVVTRYLIAKGAL